MRLWMIVLSSAIAAAVAAGAIAIPEVSSAPSNEIGQLLLPHFFAFAIAALAVYALCAMLLATATVVAGILHVRQHLLRGTVEDQPQWIVPFGMSGFRQLVPKLAPIFAQSARPEGRAALQAWFSPKEMRSEVARLYYISLARCHFFSALIILSGAVGLGLAQDRGSLPFLLGAIPTASAILTLVGLLLLAALGRIVIDVTAEPLVETIAQLPSERSEIALLRRAVELLEVVCDTPAFGAGASSSAPSQLSERLLGVIEQCHHALLSAIDRLAANTEALEAAVRSSIETLATTVHIPAVPQEPLGSASELRQAVEDLTAVIRHLSAAPRESQDPSLPPGPVARRSASTPQLARELQNLLQEIETTR
jgi:hypothetical protein